MEGNVAVCNKVKHTNHIISDNTTNLVNTLVFMFQFSIGPMFCSIILLTTDRLLVTNTHESCLCHDSVSVVSDSSAHPDRRYTV